MEKKKCVWNMNHDNHFMQGGTKCIPLQKSWKSSARVCLKYSFFKIFQDALSEGKTLNRLLHTIIIF